MWKAKIRMKQDWALASLCSKFKVEASSITATNFMKDGSEYAYLIGNLEGDRIDEVFRSLESDERIEHLYREDDRFIVIEKQGFRIPELACVKSISIDKEGLCIWDIAALNKDILRSFIDENHGEILSLKHTKLKEVCCQSIDVSEQQRRSFLVARKEGYYEFPRKTDLGKLAKLMGISRTTFREHLRKAEMKILNNTLV